MPTTTGLATSFINFSRASNATTTLSNGRIGWAGHNLLTNSESFDASAWSKQSTTVTANYAAAPNGTTTADRVVYAGGLGSPTTRLIQQGPIFSSTAGWTLTFSVWVSGTGKFRLKNSHGGVLDNYSSDYTATATPTLYTLTVTNGSSAGSGVQSVGIIAATTDDAFDLNVWGAHLFRSDLGGMQANPAMPAGMGSYYPTTPKNLVGNTEDFTAATWAKQGNTVTANAIIAPNGLQTADLITETSADTNHSFSTSTAIAPAGTVTASVYAKNAGRYLVVALSCGGVGDTQFVSAVFDLANGTRTAFNATGSQTHVASGISSVGDGWYRVYVTGTLTAVANLNMSLSTATTAPTGNYGRATYTVSGTSLGIYLWGAQLSDSASLDTYVPVYGAAVTSAAYYAPRLDFDPVTLSPRGLLVEEQRTNSLLNSRAITTSWESDGNATWVADATTSPSGVSDAGQLQYGTNGYRYQALTLTAETYTASIYVKQGTGGNGLVRLEYDTLTADFNMTTGASSNVGAGVTVHPSVNAGNGWWRFAMTFTGLASGKLFLFRMLGTLTSGQGHYFYGAQIEKGSFPTSLIISPAGATATRTADVASVSVQAFPYSASEGTLVVSGSFSSLTASGIYGLASLNNGASGNSVNLFGAPPNMNASVYASGVQTATYAIGTLTNPIKAAIAYKLNDVNAAVNGVAQTTDTTADMPTGIDRLEIGRFWGNQTANGHIRQITYLPRRISNAELQARTA